MTSRRTIVLASIVAGLLLAALVAVARLDAVPTGTLRAAAPPAGASATPAPVADTASPTPPVVGVPVATMDPVPTAPAGTGTGGSAAGPPNAREIPDVPNQVVGDRCDQYGMANGRTAAGELLMCAFDSITFSWRWRLVQG
jgi:hypothetical protein